MIFSKVLPYRKIIEQLDDQESKIAIISCNGCARICGCGGFSGANRLRFKLIRDGYNVTDVIVVLYACSELSLKELKRKIKLTSDIKTIISLACSAGWACITRNFPGKKVINATEDVGLIMIDEEKGVFELTLPYKKFEHQTKNEYEIGTGKSVLRKKTIKLEA